MVWMVSKSKFFDNVNQEKLMKLVEQRISDRRILKLIKQWLVSGVLYGNVLTISELGTSQGSVISPLLANIYLNTLDRLCKKTQFMGRFPTSFMFVERVRVRECHAD